MKRRITYSLNLVQRVGWQIGAAREGKRRKEWIMMMIGIHRKPFMHRRIRPKSICGAVFREKAPDGLINYPSFTSSPHMRTHYQSMWTAIHTDVSKGLIFQVCAMKSHGRMAKACFALTAQQQQQQRDLSSSVFIMRHSNLQQWLQGSKCESGLFDTDCCG